MVAGIPITAGMAAVSLAIFEKQADWYASFYFSNFPFFSKF
jgi:hypothetical protein